ncbi:MAG: hypothetical protein J7J75_00365 [Euryarchaeota archaeon]|nr:hypothetical protein [Euryarchaeota archaeon]MCD6158080.1 hypothetical protein [Euryarchaeota archaeon]
MIIEEWTPKAKVILSYEITERENILIKDYLRKFSRSLESLGLIRFKKLPEDIPVQVYSARYQRMIAIDPFLVYVPYHYDEDFWGVYYKYNWIMQDLEEFLRGVLSMYKTRSIVKTFESINEVSRVLYKAVAVYLSHIYHHALAHNVLEDIASILKNYVPEVSYPITKAAPEERLCEYAAFTVSPPRTVNRILDFLGKTHTQEVINIIRHTFGLRANELNIPIREYELLKAALYAHWDRANDRIYKPEIVEEIKYILPMWRPIWAVHRFSWKTVEDPKEELWDRIFWITESSSQEA